MATMNLINSSFNGKLGEVYGVKEYRQTFVKAIPFSHAPHSNAQTQSVRAFEKLNRFSSGIAKVFFQYMGLQHKKMLKHNAVAKAFACTIKNKVFNLANLAQVVPADNTTTAESLDIDYNTNTITAVFSTSEEVNKKNNSAWVCFIMSGAGEILASVAPNSKNARLSVVTELNKAVGYVSASFRADKVARGVKLHGFSMAGNLYILDGYLNIDAFPNKSLWSVADGYLATTDISATESNSQLVLNL